MILRSEVYAAIDGERSFQDEVWPDGDSQSLGEFILMLESYVSQAREQWRAVAEPEINAHHSMRKIAAIAVQCMEKHGAPRRAK